MHPVKFPWVACRRRRTDAVSEWILRLNKSFELQSSTSQMITLLIQTSESSGRNQAQTALFTQGISRLVSI